MITVAMMFFMIAIGITGFCACLAVYINILQIIKSAFGRRVFLLALILSGYWFIKAGIWENNLEQETVTTFLSSWQEISEDPSNNMAGTHMCGQVDFIRGRNYRLSNDPYLFSNNPITEYSPIEQVSSETLYLANDSVGGYESGMFKTKVFKTTVIFENGSQTDMKFWVVKDNYKIVKMEL